MECSCEIDMDCDDGQARVFNQKEVKAVKSHVCTECGADIMAGDKYELTRGMWDTKWETYKTCADCLSLRKTFFTGGYFFSQVWGDFHKNVINEYGGDVPESCISLLTNKARSKVCDEIEEYIFDQEDDF